MIAKLCVEYIENSEGDRDRENSMIKFSKAI
jgi:hypothetical protein